MVCGKLRTCINCAASDRCATVHVINNYVVLKVLFEVWLASCCLAPWLSWLGGGGGGGGGEVFGACFSDDLCCLV